MFTRDAFVMVHEMACMFCVAHPEMAPKGIKDALLTVSSFIDAEFGDLEEKKMDKITANKQLFQDFFKECARLAQGVLEVLENAGTSTGAEQYLDAVTEKGRLQSSLKMAESSRDRLRAALAETEEEVREAKEDTSFAQSQESRAAQKNAVHVRVRNDAEARLLAAQGQIERLEIELEQTQKKATYCDEVVQHRIEVLAEMAKKSAWTARDIQDYMMAIGIKRPLPSMEQIEKSCGGDLISRSVVKRFLNSFFAERALR
jgi:hypothetical protein